MIMTKHQLSLVIFVALFNCSIEQAQHNADNDHGEFKRIVKRSKDLLLEGYKQAIKVRPELSK
jgi:hypothetical protein